MKIKCGFTGTQDGMTHKQVLNFLKTISYLKPDFLSHGDCIGADEDAHYCTLFASPDTKIIVHPGYSKYKPEDTSKRAFCQGHEIREPKPFMDRNEDIVVENEVLIATPKTNEEELRSGTWSTVRKARKSGRGRLILNPNGTFSFENIVEELERDLTLVLKRNVA